MGNEPVSGREEIVFSADGEVSESCSIFPMGPTGSFGPVGPILFSSRLRRGGNSYRRSITKLRSRLGGDKPRPTWGRGSAANASRDVCPPDHVDLKRNLVYVVEVGRRGSTEQVRVTQPNAGKAGPFCSFEAGMSLGRGGSWRVVHQELRSESEEGIGYIGIDCGDERSQSVHLVFVDISRNKRGAGYQGGWRGAMRRPLGSPGKIIEYFGVFKAAKGSVRCGPPGFQIYFDTSPGLHGKLYHLPEPGSMHGAVGLPANSKNSAGVFLPSRMAETDGIGELRTGVAAEKAYAAC